MNTKTLTQRLTRVELAIHGPLRTIVFIQRTGSDVYTLSMDGTTHTRDSIDRLLAEGHSVVIRQYPVEWVDL